MKLPKISDGLVDGLGVGVDTALEVAQFIPVVGKALQLARSFRSTADALFVRKIVRFLQQVAETTAEERENFLAELDATDARERFEENLLLLLDKMDETEKAIVAGRLFRAAIRNQISLGDAERLSSIASRVFYRDLLHLEQFQEDAMGRDVDIAVTLRSNGLLAVTSEDYGQLGLESSGTTSYRLSRYGVLLLKYGLREHPDAAN